VAFPILVGDRVVGVIEFFLAEGTHRPEPELINALAACGTQLGRVVERERLERDIANATTNEQRLIGQELHDAVSQELTGIAILSERLREELHRSGVPQAEELDRLVPHLKTVQQQVRRISHGLMPVGVTPEGLMFALSRLAESEEQLCGVPCRFECPQEVLVGNSAAATQLYRIAQEAVQNAAKHAQASTVTIELTEDESAVELAVRDNGRGIVPEMLAGDGIGLRIMQHRASLIGARLVVYAPPGGGTTVLCSLPKGKLIGDFPIIKTSHAEHDGEAVRH
jgi:signal transduction histidine kinase